MPRLLSQVSCGREMRLLCSDSSSDSPDVAHLALVLREMVMDEAPEAVEKVYQNHPSAVWFGFGPKMKDMFCYIATASSHVNLGFCRGAELPDPDHVFEGAGKVMRHVKFKSGRDLERPFVRRYIRAAAEHTEFKYNRLKD